VIARNFLVAIAALLAAGLLAGRIVPLPWAERAERLLGHRRMPWLLAVLTALAFWWVAGATLDVEPVSTDEAAYLLQARIFAAGHVTAPAPPIAEFFEQAWVVVTPRLYAKYPPGQSLALAPGVALGLPWLMPLLLNALAGGLIFALLRRAAGAPAALLTWAAWVLSTMAMSWQTTYFSEVTLLACWLGAVALGWRWLEGGGPRWLLGAALPTAYAVMTRPLSILLLMLPFGVAVLWNARRTSRWRDVAQAALVGAVLLLAIPAWNLATTGRVGRSPLREYTETYLPWDRLGFAIDSTPPLRATPADLAGIAPQLVRVHREHTIARLPRTLLERAEWVTRQLFSQWRLLLALFAVIGLWRLRGPGWAAVGAVLAQFFGHAIWGHEAGWTLYYAEMAAAWFLPGAVGVVAALTWLVGRWHRDTTVAARVALAVLLALPVLGWLSVEESASYRDWRARRAADSHALTEMVRTGPGHAIYFIRYGAPRSGRPGLIRNDPWLAQARDWVVYDLGARNDELRRLAPDRTAFLVDVDARSVTPLPPLSAATPPAGRD
jgi:hypothetical protein